uniref:Uncharacterized protein n=1 Tax=Anopheles minimus TaxID=112268 RepID=A0A182VXM7_9DIPT
MEPRQPPLPLDDQQGMIIFVQILSGIHFQQEKQGRKIALTASLNQQVFEAVSQRPVTPGSGTASFNANLVWQCDRHCLKLMKNKNAPIKLDCYEVQPSEARCLVGSVVIPLRSVPVVTQARIQSLKPRWYRLIGIENERWRRIKPELKLLVMVTDSQHLNQCNAIRDDVSTPEVSGDEQTQRSEPKPEKLPSNVELLEERGLLQVGCKDTDMDLFVFEIVLKGAQHLDQLCPGTDSFRLIYELFGEQHVSMAERTKAGSAMFAIKAKIIINLRTSVAALADYFDNGFKILISVLLDRDQTLESGKINSAKAIGKAALNFVDFLKINRLEDFKANYSASNNTLDVVRNIPIFAANTKNKLEDRINEKMIIPSLKYKLSLRYLGSDGPILKDTLETLTGGTATEPAQEKNSNQQIDEQNVSKSSVEPTMKNNTKEAVPNEDATKPSTPQSSRVNFEGAQEKVNIDTILMASEQDLRDIRRTFAFRVRVGTVKFNSCPSPGLWQLALQHPKADTPFTKIRLELQPDIAVHEDRIEFGDVTLELLFSALPDRVVDTISSEPSKLTLNGPHGSCALARLDNESLLVGTRERHPAGVLVMVNEAGENVAIASVSCDLKEVGLNYNCQLSSPQPTIDCCHMAGPPVHGTQQKRFDATIAYKLVEQQKAWMQEQRKQFIKQLKEKEEKHLKELARGWKEQQTVAEKRLADRLAHVDALAAALEESQRTMETHDPQDSSRVKQIEQQFRAQLEEIRAKAIKLEQEAEAQIETTRRQSKELQEQQIQLSSDQFYLVDSNRALRNELDQERAGRAQLEERIEELAASKQHYKEQWAKLTRKVHQLEQELSMARTPYFQPSAKDKRMGKRKNATGSFIFKMTSRLLGGLCLLLVFLVDSGVIAQTEYSLAFDQTATEVYVNLQTRELRVTRSGQVVQQIRLSSNLDPAAEYAETADGFTLTNVATDGTVLELAKEVDVANYSQFSVIRNAVPSSVVIVDCANLLSTNWYGGPQQKHQYWPVQKLRFNRYSMLSKEADNSAVGDRYWLNALGAFLYVDPWAPLFVDQNYGLPGFMCLETRAILPYDTYESSYDVRYTIGVGPDAREAHMGAVGRILGKPSGHPAESMVTEPIWSTWARYKRDINDTVVLQFAQEIITNGFGGQYELDDDWEWCYGALTFNRTKFPDIRSTITKIRQLGFGRTTLWIHPFINKGCEPWYSDARRRGYLVADHSGNTDTEWWNSLRGQAAYVDFTKAEVREWFTTRLQAILDESGIDSFKFDAGESSWTPPDPVLNGPPGRRPSQIIGDYIRTVAEFGDLVEVRSALGTQDLPVFVRMIDKDSNWGWNNGLPTLITTLLQLNMVGYPLVLPDMVGGNGYDEGPPSKEMFIRWLQANVFMPSIQFSFVPWDFDHETVTIALAMTELHRRIAPAIMERFALAVSDGLPVNAPLWWIDPSDVTAQKIYDQYLLGDDIIAAPVIVENARARDIYLPRGSWTDGNTGEQHTGPKWLRNYSVPLSMVPYFTRKVV